MEELRNPTGRVAVVGTGAVGAAVARRLLAGGYDVTVWNRTPARTAALTGAGARSARTVDEAVAAGELVLLALTDHEAVQQCLDRLDGGLAGRTVVALCTGTPEEARRTAQRVAGLGGHHLDAGLQAGPDTIGTDAATLLFSGDPSAYERHAGTFGLLGTARFVGTAPEAASVWDLALFGLWYDAQLGLLRAMDAVRAAGVDVSTFAPSAENQLGHVVSAVSATASEIAGAEFPRGPADLGEHLTVVRHLVGLRAGRPLGDGGLAEVAARMEALVAQGRGAEGLTATVG
ncbi:NAD(P)-dependent oxidoreductase [Micromonospora coxensis]|uniref:3-hydroxyisobutyrate dehydrogenase n=1 Tax=Micromonospora coxensis TaxID=356852 RepID=A0A1C5ILX0_9ACTN|nr:NAD(P)-binding domain-containing protein [Micromonospora coxensis]SCG59133.1 3-hydroxyisobutyrate dehydrogenase [Micromonospora coxensis]